MDVLAQGERDVYYSLASEQATSLWLAMQTIASAHVAGIEELVACHHRCGHAPEEIWTGLKMRALVTQQHGTCGRS